MRDLRRLEQLPTLCGMEPPAAVFDSWLEFDPDTVSMTGPPSAADPAEVQSTQRARFGGGLRGRIIHRCFPKLALVIMQALFDAWYNFARKNEASCYMQFGIDSTGGAMARSILSILILLSISAPSAAERVVRIVDLDGQPVERFEVMFHTADQGYDRWAGGRDGIFHNTFSLDSYKKAAAIDVIVRAEGYASVSLHFSGKDKQALLAGGAELKLSRGREVRLVVVPPEGITLPADLLPEVYFADLAWRVEMMWQPDNQRIEQSDFNMLGIQPIPDKPGEYVMRVADDQAPFMVGIHRPGLSQNFKAGPFTAKDFADGQMKLPIGRQSSITAKLTWGDADQDSLPFNGVNYHLMRQLHPGGNSYTTVASGDRTLDDTSFHADELAPGHYMLMLRTKPKIESDPDSDEMNIGSFADRKTFDVVAGQDIECVSTYQPFNPDAYRGEQTARIKIFDINGQLAAGKTLAISYYDGHYGQLDVFEGKIPADGVVSVTNITDKARDDIPFGPYTASVDGERVGFFRVAASDEPQDFAFHLIPEVGDAAPDIELVDLDTKEPLRLSELRGKFVYLEFWDTGCGPCQGELEKLNELVGANGEKWQKDVVVLSLATDAEQQIIIDHVRRKGWNQLRHYWSQHSGGDYFADAVKAYIVHAVPTALFIDRDGKILYRGHPASFDLTAEIEKRVAPD